MRRFKQPDGSINMTAMIDVVFQMIIFFVCTVQLEQEAISEWIRLPDSPNGPMIAEEKDPRTITIEVDGQGKIFIARTRLSEEKLRKVLSKTVQDYGDYGPSIPIRIRADAAARHTDVKRVLDACSSAGLYKISFIATKDKA
ncbi:MAG: biopolymer transporter ExbD [Pontiellaceae bacterium]|jgi:biopolymer transport protein ExbD|nr:biopolymer transporter ExbD [Pontiellaceae bacterium]